MPANKRLPPRWTAPSGFTNAAQVQLSGISSAIANGAGPASASSTGSPTATTSASGQLTGVFLAFGFDTATTTTAYDADDEATLVTDPDGNATLTCYDGDGHIAETVPPVGVAANALSASSCPDQLSHRLRRPPGHRRHDDRIRRPRKQDHGDLSSTSGAIGLRDHHLRLRRRWTAYLGDRSADEHQRRCGE